MARRRVIIAVASGLLCAMVAATPARAQTAASARSAVASGLGVRAFGVFEWQKMAASRTFDAVTDKTTLSGVGAGAEVHRLWRNVFVRASFSQSKETGQRVFVFNNEVFKLGVPVEVSATPIELAVGWRFTPFSSRGIVPYLGGGALFLKYSETSSGDERSDQVHETYKGFAVFGGLEVPVWRHVSAGAELGWRSANVPEPGGVLEAFDEKNLGGLAMRLMVSVRK
ncbi:MAG: outer membrane beta-barrel protein [Acidobacteria bacterium]|jgi:hypothetical protein|nr:outer membrane beta-barrel protein [Acidobacteriota bacterium]